MALRCRVKVLTPASGSRENVRRERGAARSRRDDKAPAIPTAPTLRRLPRTATWLTSRPQSRRLRGERLFCLVERGDRRDTSRQTIVAHAWRLVADRWVAGSSGAECGDETGHRQANSLCLLPDFAAAGVADGSRDDRSIDVVHSRLQVVRCLAGVRNPVAARAVRQLRARAADEVHRLRVA